MGANDKISAAYLTRHAKGELESRIKKARERLAECESCPRQCGVNRLEDERGICRTGLMAEVSSYAPHFGEESPLVGESGSGTIFFSRCNLLCLFCQNYEISHLGEGREVSDAQLAAMMISLQRLI